VPESIRNAIVVAFIAVLMAMVGVGLLAWSRRPASPAARVAPGLPLLVNDRDGGISDLNVLLQQMERKLGDSQVASQRLMEQLKAANEERDQLTSRLGGLEKEVRSLRKRVQDAEQRLPPRPPPAATTSAPPVQTPAATSTPTDTAPGAPP
jgi:septal ring factor EnvC (AmiA/AmiB activator)